MAPGALHRNPHQPPPFSFRDGGEEKTASMKRRAIKRLAIVSPERLPFRECRAVVAIPARNEAERIVRCLAALAIQRDRLGAPIEAGSFGVLLLVNNSNDGTAAAARQLASEVPFSLEVLDVTLLQNATAGGARRRAMDEAATRMRGACSEGILLTTDADSVVTPTWYADNLAHLENGADCVAGYIDAEPAEIVSHGPAFLSRGRFEDTYLRLVAEIYAHCDPRPHDPWPNHRVSSGASLAVRLSAYDAIGGMPDNALGEDGAFTALLDEGGFRVRHALDVSVLTSCRLDGRAGGGAADTMRYRRDVPDAPCDADLEPASAALCRATMRGLLRRSFQQNKPEQAMRRLLGWSRTDRKPAETFMQAWKELEARHPNLRRAKMLRPSDLPRQIAAAKFILRHLRFNARKTSVPADRCRHAGSPELTKA